MNENILNTAN